MMTSIIKIKWDDYGEAIPAFVLITCMPLTYNIGVGEPKPIYIYIYIYIYHSVVIAQRPLESFANMFDHKTNRFRLFEHSGLER